jgi:hypothetical protein
MTIPNIAVKRIVRLLEGRSKADDLAMKAWAGTHATRKKAAKKGKR